ncbi:MAG: methylenetetrahydrofolate--tRNA-(uracil(54)-C(5))-methyltransferase (FADH(2)-oxidizing) TrmFO [Desulfopila sp.]|nr:methylenetetrahydrofolate--tRNA-(uracil(54)-C(5))-methyltransferase (FADH(2)-oxidizing) TrmFO [Desulfopila sp.]
MTILPGIVIIGGGLAGCEAAWQAANAGCTVTLYEMKPARFSPAHESESLAELVCSNSFRSDAVTSAVGLLKEEMRILNSLVLYAAARTAVPAGKALAVDRLLFAEDITSTLQQHPHITIHREEIMHLPETYATPYILATGPLTSDAMADSLSRLTGAERLSFYDAIAPIVEEDSLNRDIVYQKSRYDDGPGDYLNCPMSREQYVDFIAALRLAEQVPLHDFENVKYFEGCLPIEVMCERGEDTLRFGPMKPVGLPDPRTGRDPYAVVQLRRENLSGSHYNMVGFQTKLSYTAQKELFRTIPGMENARFSRLGSIHRNTFIRAPELLLPTLQLRHCSSLLIAGQLSGVEGYIESAAMGLLAGINGARLAMNDKAIVPPKDTALGALINHLTTPSGKHFQPSNVNFSLFPPLQGKIAKKLRGQIRAEQALKSLRNWCTEEGVPVTT